MQEYDRTVAEHSISSGCLEDTSHKPGCIRVLSRDSDRNLNLNAGELGNRLMHPSIVSGMHYKMHTGTSKWQLRFGERQHQCELHISLRPSGCWESDRSPYTAGEFWTLWQYHFVIAWLGSLAVPLPQGRSTAS